MDVKMEREINQQKNQLLLRTIRSHPQAAIQVHDKMRMDAWEAVMAKIGKEVSDAPIRFKSLMNGYRQVRRRNRKNKKKGRWIYFNEMEKIMELAAPYRRLVSERLQAEKKKNEEELNRMEMINVGCCEAGETESATSETRHVQEADVQALYARIEALEFQVNLLQMQLSVADQKNRGFASQLGLL